MSTLRDQLTDIYAAHGRLTADLVVAAARPTGSALHHRFEWDDAAAGEAYRKQQAADLIRSVKVVYKIDPTGSEKSVRAFPSSRSAEAPDESTYRPIEEVVADPFAYQMLLNECRREWKSFEAKYGHLEEFAQIVKGEAA